MRDYIDKYLVENQQVIQSVCDQKKEVLVQVTHLLIGAFETDRKLLIIGNGGSAADAQHFAAELVGRFRCERAALPAIALTTNTSILTALGNDYGFEHVFSRQIEALARPGDVVFAISTSGRSPNVVRALETARRLGCTTIVLTGGDGGFMLPLVDAAIVVPSDQTPLIQEAHLAIIHILCGLIEMYLTGQVQSDTGAVS